MINIKNKQDCCGCGACLQCCPKKCIVLKEDTEGFLYPMVNKEICINCGLCEKVCPELNPYPKRTPLYTYAAINTNEEIRMQSSSGGIFTLLAEKVIDESGIVFGARFDDDWQVTIDFTETKEGLSAFRGSKYLQARTNDTFKQCEKFLKQGRKVLYSGTPCQISGLKHFLRKEYDNLVTVDFVCHGVPSPKVWKRYLTELHSVELIKKINMRDKSTGWKHFSFKVNYSRDKSQLSFSSVVWNNPYMKAFLSDLILRPSCHACSAKEFRTNSDITIADFWGIWNINPKLYDDKGTSLVLIHNPKVKDFLLETNSLFSETLFNDAKLYNSAIYKSSRPHPKREFFWRELDNNANFSKLVYKITSPTGINAIKIFIKRLIKTIIRK